MDLQEQKIASSNLEPPVKDTEDQLELEGHMNETIEGDNQEIVLNSHFTGTDELDTRPHSNSAAGYPEGLPEEDTTILRRLHRRFARIQEKKPVMTQNLSELITMRFTFFINNTVNEKCEQVYLASFAQDAQLSRELFDMFNRIESKVISTRLSQASHPKQAKSESLEMWVKKYELYAKRNQVEKLLFTREELKEHEQLQKKKAVEFSIKMKQDSDHIVEKLKEQADMRTRKAQSEQQQAVEREMQKKRQQIEQQRIKAESALSEVKLRKQHREQTKRIAALREKKVHEVTPLHIIKELEFKKQEDQLYNSRGRNLESLQKFLQEKKRFHLLRNKKNFDLYLLDPDFEETYGRLNPNTGYSALKTSMNTRNNLRQSKLEKSLLMGGLDAEEAIKSRPLPRIKYSHK
jgi:hypothetical protein